MLRSWPRLPQADACIGYDIQKLWLCCDTIEHQSAATVTALARQSTLVTGKCYSLGAPYFQCCTVPQVQIVTANIVVKISCSLGQVGLAATCGCTLTTYPLVAGKVRSRETACGSEMQLCCIHSLGPVVSPHSASA